MTEQGSTARDTAHDDRTKPSSSRFEIAGAFCRAAAAAHQMTGSVDRRVASEDHLAAAATALVELARLDAYKALAVALRPDPDVEESLWTVACYQIGDLIPCALADFNDAAKAVEAIADCEDESHVAAELIASTGTGVRWTALVRVGERVKFQLASEDSASSGSGAQAGALERALEHWHTRLEQWAQRDGDEALGESPVPEEVRSSPQGDAFGALVSEIVSSLEKVQSAIAHQDHCFEEIVSRLDTIERRLSSVIEAIRNGTRPKASFEERVADPSSMSDAGER